MGAQTQLTEKSSDNLELGILQFTVEVQWFILRKTIVFQGFRGVPSFSKGVRKFSGVGIKMLISIEPRSTYDFPGGVGGFRPYPTSVSAHALIVFRILAPFNYVERYVLYLGATVEQWIRHLLYKPGVA